MYLGLWMSPVQCCLKCVSKAAALLKLSRRDLAYACGLRFGSAGSSASTFNGGTTIASTMLLAHKAGIKVFATGGLGGVHRGAELSWDVSADLTELGRTPVAVVCSGCKAFLDIPKTLEYLETQGVGVLTFADGRGGGVDFPAFWSRDSGFKSPMVVRDEREAASVICEFSRGVWWCSTGQSPASARPQCLPCSQLTCLICSY